MTTEQFTKTVFSQYAIVKVLADKNGCKTLRLRHKTLSKDVVMHIFPKVYEAYEVLCKIRCKSLPEIYDAVKLDDGQIVFEEYIDGITVAEVMETGKYRYGGAKNVICSVCEALTVLHKNGFVHRDVKPENVVIDNGGRVVLIDFNASRKVSLASKDTVVMGTVGYASPEQLGVAQSDSRTDIYAVGVLLNVMLTGCHPSTRLAKGRAGRIVENCTNINPGRRFQSAEKLAAEL